MSGMERVLVFLFYRHLAIRTFQPYPSAAQCCRAVQKQDVAPGGRRDIPHGMGGSDIAQIHDIDHIVFSQEKRRNAAAEGVAE